MRGGRVGEIRGGEDEEMHGWKVGEEREKSEN